MSRHINQIFIRAALSGECPPPGFNKKWSWSNFQDPNILIGDPNILIGDPNILIGDPNIFIHSFIAEPDPVKMGPDPQHSEYISGTLLIN